VGLATNFDDVGVRPKATAVLCGPYPWEVAIAPVRVPIYGNFLNCALNADIRQRFVVTNIKRQMLEIPIRVEVASSITHAVASGFPLDPEELTPRLADRVVNLFELGSWTRWRDF
jgi:hypothetical protein